jgi:hypothetical protein
MFKHVDDVKLNKIPNKTNFDLFNKIKSILDKNQEVVYEKLGENLIEIEALSLECAFIEFYGIDSLCNYFKSWSGSMVRSEKTRKRQSDANKGPRSYMFGKPKTQEQNLKNSIAHKGRNNPRYINDIYDFYNPNMNIRERCTPFELRTKYGLDSGAVCYLITGRRFSTKGWTLGYTLDEIENIRREKISKSNKGKPKSESHRRNLWKNRRKFDN